jgi:hypothetical protein
VRRRDRPLGDALDQLLGAAAVMDEVGDRADLEAVLVGEALEVGEPAIVPSCFMTSQITAAGVRPASAARSQQASVWPARTSTPPAARSRENVARLHDVCGRRRAATAARTVRARSAAEMPVATPSAGLDRDRESGAVAPSGCGASSASQRAPRARAVIGRHTRPRACVAMEVDLLGVTKSRRDEVALVLAVLVVDEHDDAAGLQVGDDLGTGASGMAAFYRRASGERELAQRDAAATGHRA